MPIQFPLALKPVARSRERGLADDAGLPYHPAILIIDAAGRRVTDVAPDADDIRAGRIITDPHVLVSRATQVVAWLQDIHSRLSAWADALGDRPEKSLGQLRARVLKRHDAAVSILAALQEAVQSWRSTDAITAGGESMGINDGALEH